MSIVSGCTMSLSTDQGSRTTASHYLKGVHQEQTPLLVPLSFQLWPHQFHSAGDVLWIEGESQLDPNLLSSGNPGDDPSQDGQGGQVVAAKAALSLPVLAAGSTHNRLGPVQSGNLLLTAAMAV